MAFSFYKTKRIRFIFLAYWLLLAYIIAALIWWFIALNMQNHQMATYKMEQLKKDDTSFFDNALQINETEKRKTAQYIGEGSIFLLLIITGAVFLFRAVRRQFKSNQQQQNFIMAITHELKTPIAVTKLNLETLQKRKLEEPQQQSPSIYTQTGRGKNKIVTIDPYLMTRQVYYPFERKGDLIIIKYIITSSSIYYIDLLFDFKPAVRYRLSVPWNSNSN